MGEEKKIKITFVNRYYPPNQSVTGDSAAELVRFLENKSSRFDLHTVSINAQYKGKNTSSNTTENTHFIPSFYNGDNKIFRFFSNFYEGYRLIKKAIKIKSDLVICLTDPPLVNFWASVLCKKNKSPWALWSMDVYPDAFVAAKLVSKNNLIYKYLQKRITENPPQYLLALGNVQKEYLLHQYNKEIETIIIPCGIHNVPKNTEKPLWKKDDEKIYFAYAGNLGEAHSEQFLNSFIALMDKERHHLILSVYGAKSSKINTQNKDSITLIDRLNKSDFSYIDVHIVTLLPEWTNICVPSKAVSAICAESTVLFNGLENSDTSKMLHDASWIINSDRNIKLEEEQLLQFLNLIKKEEIELKKNKAKIISHQLNHEKLLAFERFSNLILAAN